MRLTIWEGIGRVGNVLDTGQLCEAPEALFNGFRRVAGIKVDACVICGCSMSIDAVSNALSQCEALR